MQNQFQFPTEEVTLPSKGLLYPEDSPLSSGKIEMKYMTAKEEDILTNTNYIQDGSVIDRILKSLIVTKVDFNDILIGDKNAILVAARILGYGKDYEVEYNGTRHIIDLSKLNNRELDESLYEKGKNEFKYTLPKSNIELTFKLLTNGDEIKIEEHLKGLKKISKNSSAELTTRLKHTITAVNGDSDVSTINNFVDNYFLAVDSRAFRKHVADLQPDIDLTFYPEDGPEGGVAIPIGITFFWPDA